MAPADADGGEEVRMFLVWSDSLAAEPVDAVPRRSGASAGLLSLLFVACAAEPDGEPGVAPATGPPRYVGSAVCAGCHRSEAERWSGSHHDLAFPAHRELVEALASFHRDLWELEVAIGYARKLVALGPDDPSAGQLLAELEDRAREPR